MFVFVVFGWCGCWLGLLCWWCGCVLCGVGFFLGLCFLVLFFGGVVVCVFVWCVWVWCFCCWLGCVLWLILRFFGWSVVLVV
ncbi:hypothetical protein RA265_27830 [Pseudomonas syringae pv. tagetis]|uniref:hypothetical protein n=1 Tax=Pseudomonas syringae group genomosp. 7 TaxID=251699 RepID=UPI00376FC9DB